MAITAITRDWSDDPSCVRIVTTDALATIIAPGYITAQAANIQALQNGNFQWQADDFCMISFNGGRDLFVYDPVNLTFVLKTKVLYATQSLTAAQFLGAYATPVQITAIPTPGATQIIDVIRWGLDMTFVTTQYAAGGAIQLQYGNTVHGGGNACCGTIAAATVNAFAATSQVETSGAMTGGANAGQAVYLSNATAAFTTGDGTFLVPILYTVRNI